MTRNQFVQSFRNHVIFVLSNASMHGLIHVVRSRRHPFERFLWIGLVVGAFAVATHQALQAWHRYETSPVVITVEKDFLNWNVEFPAVIICFQEKPVKSEITKFATQHNITVDMKEFQNYITDIMFNNYLTYKNLEIYANGTKQDYVPADLYLELVSSVSRRASFKRKGKAQPRSWPNDVNGTYDFILTEFGFCHSFHSQLAPYFDIDKFTTQTWPSNYIEITKSYKDKPMLFIENEIFADYLLFVPGPDEMIDITSHHSLMDKINVVDFSTILLNTLSDEDLKDITPSQRNCKFANEKESMEYYPVYTHTLCRIECRMTLALRYCNCTPYYYRRKAGELVCNMTGMYCLSKYPELVTLVDPQTTENLCPCMQNCNNQVVTLDLKSNGPFFLSGNLKIAFDTFPTERYRRSLILTKTDILIQVGSLFGLYLGCSVLSLIEIPYFFTLRFFWGVFGHKRIDPEV